MFHRRRVFYSLALVFLAAFVAIVFEMDLSGAVRDQITALHHDCRLGSQGCKSNNLVFPNGEDLSDSTEFARTSVEGLKQTTIPGGAYSHGFTIFDNLYMRNGTLYALTDKPMSIPRLIHVLSQPLPRRPGGVLTPTEQEMQVISPNQASSILGDHALRLGGFTVLLYEPQQFMDHYYHWWAENILGFWRVYSKLGIREGGNLVPLPLPARFMAPFVDEKGWRDEYSVNGPLMQAAFAGTTVETREQWEDLVELDATIVFSRVIVISREAAHKHPLAISWAKMIGGTMSLSIPDGFWSPIRKSVVVNLLGNYSAPPTFASAKPIVTLVSRQGGRRQLNQGDHNAIVTELMKLEEEGLCEVQVVHMENMSLKAQIEMAAKTTIMIGVHGNGLTHQLWMTPSSKSTVIEIFAPRAYVYDYEILSRNLGHRHYAIWNDTYLTYPKGTTHGNPNAQVPGFHGFDIPASAETITNIVRSRLDA